MDPNTALANAREAAAELRNADDDDTLSGSQVGFLVRSFEALDGWLTKGGFAPREWLNGHPTSLYQKCATCHLFVEPNTAPGDHAPYVHLHRGDEADEALDASHEAEPSGQIATISAWMRYGPVEMRDRFLDVAIWAIEQFQARKGDYLAAIDDAEMQLRLIHSKGGPGNDEEDGG